MSGCCREPMPGLLGLGLEGLEGVEKPRLPRLPVEPPPPARAQATDSTTTQLTKTVATIRTRKRIQTDLSFISCIPLLSRIFLLCYCRNPRAVPPFRSAITGSFAISIRAAGPAASAQVLRHSRTSMEPLADSLNVIPS